MTRPESIPRFPRVRDESDYVPAEDSFHSRFNVTLARLVIEARKEQLARKAEERQ